MTEGGLLYWKIQKIKYGNGPPADYSQVLHPLPDPPKGMIWKKDESTGEWSVVKKDIKSHSDEDWEVLDIDDKIKKTYTTNQIEVNYIEHLVLPTDTFEGICLNYKISPTKLRQFNKFSGSNLLLAPKKLKIPIDGKNIIDIKVQDTSSDNYKIHTLVHEFRDLSVTEAKAYLEMNKWDVEGARNDVKGDCEWELRQLEGNTCIHDHNVHLEVHEGVPVATSTTLKKELELEMRPLL